MGAPLLAHRIRRPAYVPFALGLLQRAPFASMQTAVCGPLAFDRRVEPMHCLARGWRWCNLPYRAAGPMSRVPSKSTSKSKGKGTRGSGKASVEFRYRIVPMAKAKGADGNAAGGKGEGKK